MTSSTSQQTFPRWVDVLFTRLAVRYGDAWSRKWEGIPEHAVKADWQEQLDSVFTNRPQAIAHALNNLPADFPPNSEQFRKMCAAAPELVTALPAPAADPAVIAKAVESVGRRPVSYDGAKACADALRDRRARMGGKLGLAQKAQLAALEAIGK